MLSIESNAPDKKQKTYCLDVAERADPITKRAALIDSTAVGVTQSSYLESPDCRITSDQIDGSNLLERHAISPRGVVNGDQDLWLRFFWELPSIGECLRWIQRAVQATTPFSGREQVIDWSTGGKGMLRPGLGNSAYGQDGVSISRMSQLPACLYTGELYDQNSAVIVPKTKAHLPAIWALCISPAFLALVRKLDKKLGVTPATLLKIPFDLAHWQKVASEKYPNGLPKPHSDDPTQWLFNGHPKDSEQPLHVAVPRLLGYRWPRQTGSSFPDCPALGPDGLESFADQDGIVCLPPINREQPAASRLRQLLTSALGSFDERALIATAGTNGSTSTNLEDWLRNEFFEQHCKLFHNRPFIWHLWDGSPDGFHVLVNYHKLDYANLQKLTYSYLGDWIRQQDEDAKADKPGAADRLGAAKTLQSKLDAILKGEAPLDIFVRWETIKDQAQGWHPDINDGVRQNIRPFLFAGDVGKKSAGLFRTVPLKLNDKDRGTEPMRPKQEYPWFWCKEEPGTDPTGGNEFVGNRWNNVHLTLARKQQAKS